MIKVVKYLLVIGILGVTSPAFAAPQWMTMIELPTLTYQIDQETVGITREDKDNHQLDVWIKMVDKNQGGAYSLAHYLVKESDLSFVMKERTFYSPDGAVTSTYKNPEETWSTTTTNSPIGNIASRLFTDSRQVSRSGKNLPDSNAEPQLTATQWLVAKGKANYAVKEYDKAITAYSQAIKLNPQLSQAVIERGQSYLMTKRFDLAQSDFTTAIELNPQSEVLYWFRGLAYAGQGKDQLAIDEYTKTLRINPKMFMAYWNMALSQDRLGMRYLAKQAYVAYIRYAPDDDVFMDKAKKRLTELNAMDKAGNEPPGDFNEVLNKTMANNKSSAITFDYLGKDYLTVTFDKPRWKVGYKEIGKNIIVEFVTGQETVQCWTELITVQFLGSDQKLSPRQCAGFLEKKYRAEFGDRLSFRVLKDQETDVIIEYWVAGQAGMADEHTITRMFKGNASLGIVHYAMKSSMTPEKRDAGFSIIEGVKYSDHLRENDNAFAVEK